MSKHDDGPSMRPHGLRKFFRMSAIRSAGTRYQKERHQERRYGVQERGKYFVVVLMSEEDGGVMIMGDVQAFRAERDADAMAEKLNGLGASS